MARTRNIKPAFFKNENLAELKPIERLLFIGLWTLADYKGCLEYRPKRIKAEILPYDDIDIDPTLTRLTPDHIRTYIVDGVKYIKIINFVKHQNPHKKERDAGSELPDLTEENVINQDDSKKPDLDPTQHGVSRALNLKPLTSNLKPLTLNSIIENADANFEEFWNLYNYKIDRKKAEEKFRLALKVADFQIIKNAIPAYKAYCLNTNTPQKHPSTWLFNKCWENDYQQLMKQQNENNSRNFKQNDIFTNRNYGKPTVTDAVNAISEQIARGEI